ncbi:aromatic motif membrane protein [Mesomycoplasma molare]|uniref:Lipoprotein n=1 Tax=Mesomycoplasma molare TaxID=171288 RepID=A0ABY5TV80_9BACT|nr:aromatic motif membrane protein [Mesomycoplasma molare]UWD34578.1 hypothetical protein NX772_01985 [Mesomycoplasma molare]
MKRIFKKIIFSLFLLFSFCSASCSHQKEIGVNSKELKDLVVFNEREIKWNNFLNKSYVDTILKMVFNNNEKEKEKYIESQKKLDDNYLEELKTWVRYSNNIVFPYDKTERFILSSSGQKRNFVTSFGSEKLDELYNKNWLFFLFNLDKFVFLQYPDVSTSDNENKELIDEIEASKRIYDDFYVSQSNEIIDYVIQKYNIEVNEIDNSELYEDRIFLLTKDGRIIRFDISGSKTNDKINIRNSSLHSYLYSYPKLIKSANKLNDFDLKKYVEVVKEWGDFDYKFSESKKIIYIDEYGNREFRYTLINIKEEK